jgi:hypothetical protein
MLSLVLPPVFRGFLEFCGLERPLSRAGGRQGPPKMGWTGRLPASERQVPIGEPYAGIVDRRP